MNFTRANDGGKEERLRGKALRKLLAVKSDISSANLSHPALFCTLSASKSMKNEKKFRYGIQRMI